jgi:hypothetical protein
VETKKSKVFTHKLIALFLSVLMALSCFTGALTAFAASDSSSKNYHDGNLAYNFMAWAETTDEQTAEALLDYADLYLGDIITSLLGSDHISFSQNIVIDTIKIDAYLDSIDGLFDTVRQVQTILSKYGNVVGGDVKNIDLTPISNLSYATSGDYVVSKCNKSYRQVYSAKELLMAFAKVIYINSNNFAGKNVIGQFFKGQLDIGSLLESILKDDVYGLLQSTFNMWDGYEDDVVYNIVANIILNNTKWYTDEEKTAYYNDLQKTSGSRTNAWNFDDVLFKALNEQLLSKISVLVTYNNRVYDSTEGKYVNDSSKLRKEENRIQDSKLVYSSEEAYSNNVLLFQYDRNGDGVIENIYDDEGKITNLEKLELNKDDNLFNFAFRAVELAWDTVLKDTLSLVNVNYDVDRGNGSNFDNVFYDWMTGEGQKGWDYDDWKSNYSKANVLAWAEAEYESYSCSSADEFLENVKHTYEYDRSVVSDAKNNWQDIDSQTLFNKLRYNPLADLYFDMQTGPINLYFQQTGIKDIETFFKTAFTSYSNLVSGFNDALVAVTKVVFIDSDNIGYGTENNKPVTNLSVPTMKETNNTLDKETIAKTLVSNFMSMFEYAANVTDANIINPFYSNNKITSLSGNLEEGNFEEAMIPLLIACLNTTNLDLTEMIHDEKWDSAKDAEGVAIVVLEEYLSYVLPDKDYSVLWTYDDDGYIVAKSGTLFNTAVLPMVRDALGYVIASVVPCRDTEGNEWDVYTAAVDDKTTIFDILNSVICYYASQDGFSDGTKGKAVASLLGAVNTDGKCLVTSTNTIWENLDNIINSLLPVVGTLQYGDSSKAGQASTEELIYDGLIKGILDVGEENEHTHEKGLTSIIEQILTIVTAEPISKKGVDCMIYDDIVASFINGLFGARYDGQGYDKVIPYSSYYDSDTYYDSNTSKFVECTNTKSESPFDSLITAQTLAHYSASNDTPDKSDTGVIGILICNLYEIFGGADYNNDGTKGAWQGAMFAVEAVNNFIPSFVPELSDHTLNAASSEVALPSQSGITSGDAIEATTLDITNNAMGLNRMYRDENGTVHRDKRYFINVTNFDVSTSTGAASTVTFGNVKGVIAPEKTKRVSVTGTGPSESTLYTLTITYDVFLGELDSNGNLPTETEENCVYSGLETIAYMYITPDTDWAGTVYSRSSEKVPNSASSIPDSYTSIKEVAAAYESTGNSTTEYTQNIKFRGDKLIGTWTNSLIIPMSDASVIKNYGFRIKNIASGTSAYAVDGVYTYYTKGTEYYAVSDGTISDTLTSKSADDTKMAYVAIDKSTGNILNYDLYDYYNPLTQSWDRGTKQSSTGVYSGYTTAEIKELSDEITSGDGYAVRTHVAYTIDEAVAGGYVSGVIRTASSFDTSGNPTAYVYDAVYIDLNNSTYATNILKGMYENSSKESVTMGTPTPGIYLAMPKTNIPRNTTYVCRWINYDGSTELTAADYDMPLCLYSSGGSGTGTTHIYIADDTGSSTLTNSYNDALSTVSPYRQADFTDYDEETESSEVYSELNSALAKALKAISEPVTTKNATALGSTTIAQASTKTTTESYGDPAYEPVAEGESLPGSIAANVTKSNGYCYYNEECTIPVYKNVPLSHVTTGDDGKSYDPTGAEVVKVDGVWYLANNAVYDTEWDTTTSFLKAPYLKTTDVQSTNNNGELLYKEVNFVYRDANGNKVKSTDDWAFKFAETSKTIKPADYTNEVDYRGTYQVEIDRLSYWLEELQSKVDTTLANKIVQEVTLDRQGMNNVNYDVASYEKMVQVAKSAEKLVWNVEDTGKVDENGNEVYTAETNKSSLQIDSAISMYQSFMSRVISRGYIGNKLEAEISCATSPNYNGTTSTTAVYTYSDFDYDGTEVKDNSGTVTGVQNATVTSTTANDAEYGAWVDGTLVNEGETVYTDASWSAYVDALANAIRTADLKTAKVSEVYTTKKALQIAENNLTDVNDATDEPEVDGIVISGKVVVATNENGTEYFDGIVGINIYYDATIDTSNNNKVTGKLVATTAEDGTFTAVVPEGTTELVFDAGTTIPRTVTLSGTSNVKNAIVPIVVCDYNHDGYINGSDSGEFVAYLDEHNVYADINGDGNWNGSDSGSYSYFVGKTVSYADLKLD